jgi:hypothetical protein
MSHARSKKWFHLRFHNNFKTIALRRTIDAITDLNVILLFSDSEIPTHIVILYFDRWGREDLNLKYLIWKTPGDTKYQPVKLQNSQLDINNITLIT